jgi:hypothetical protein
LHLLREPCAAGLVGHAIGDAVERAVGIAADLRERGEIGQQPLAINAGR